MWDLKKVEGTNDHHIQIRNQATSGFLAAVKMNPKLDSGRRRVITEIDTREFSPVAHVLASSLGEEHTWEVDDEDGFFQLKNIRKVLRVVLGTRVCNNFSNFLSTQKPGLFVQVPGYLIFFNNL
jgi:hypothetical protein